ncbi:helix-hairpin-helix domain-containing protein [Embleya sp. MST-111070]|uniref:helix-hairpin-helix domain-containing protein n=1 Tax=Embleya sp. MST-111070 TaxID=3398231 RepID=UPI003F734407
MSVGGAGGVNGGGAGADPEDVTERRAGADPGATATRAGSEHGPSDPEPEPSDARDSRPKADPVALLRDQLARLARGEAPEVVGGVAHIETADPTHAERARRRTTVAAEAAEAEAAAIAAAEAEAEAAAEAAVAAEKARGEEARGEGASADSAAVEDPAPAPSSTDEEARREVEADDEAAPRQEPEVGEPGAGDEAPPRRETEAGEEALSHRGTRRAPRHVRDLDLPPEPDSEGAAVESAPVDASPSPAIGDVATTEPADEDTEAETPDSTALAAQPSEPVGGPTNPAGSGDAPRSADESAVRPPTAADTMAATPKPADEGAAADGPADSDGDPDRGPEGAARVDRDRAAEATSLHPEAARGADAGTEDASPGVDAESDVVAASDGDGDGSGLVRGGGALASGGDGGRSPLVGESGTPARPGVAEGGGRERGAWGRPGGGASDPGVGEVERRPFGVVVADVARLLGAAGAPEGMAPQVVAALGSEAAELLAGDPWALLGVAGIAPQQADLFARGALGTAWAADDPRRVRAIVLWLLRRAARQGDTAIEADAVRAALGHFEVGESDTALRAILAEGRVMAFAAVPAASAEEGGEEGGDFDETDDGDGDFEADFEEPDELAAVGGVLLALDDYALAEEAIAEAVVRLMSTVEPWPEFGDGKLDRALASTGVVLYAAGPGEEPPAAISAVVAKARAAGLRVTVVAPTLDGRDRLGAGAVGLRELAAMERGPDGTLELDLLVVTDATLLDVTAAAAIFEAVPDGARLLLAGDPAGLESTGPGRVFTDLAATGAIRALVAPNVPDGPLEALADGIRDGRLPPIRDPERRVVLIPARTGEEAAHRCAQLVADSIPRAIGIAARDVLVVAPLATGPAGANALNAALKARLNPGPGGGSSPTPGAIDVGDRVIRATTDPSCGVVQGTVRELLPDGRAVVVFGTAAPEAVPPMELRHGWALTARQSLGVRRPAAVVVLPAEGADAYTRALMYTLVTRGERHVSIVHAAGPALAAAVAADPTRQRTTHLRQAFGEAAG